MCSPLLLLQVEPQRLGPALFAAPKVLGFSLQEVERRLMGLTWIQPHRQQLAEVGWAVAYMALS